MDLKIPFDFHLLIHFILYLVSFVIGFVVSVPFGITQNNFGGNCFLNLKCDWKNQSYFVSTFSQSNECHFVTSLAVVSGILYGFAMCVYYGYAVVKSRADPRIALQMWVMPFLLLNALILITNFIAACVISVGFASTCRSLTSTSAFSTCRDAQKGKWYPTTVKVDATTFYDFVIVAQSAMWVGVLVWTLQVALTALRFYRNRKQRQQDGEVIVSDQRQYMVDNAAA